MRRASPTPCALCAPQAFLFLQPTDFTHQPHESLWDLHPGLRVMYEMVAGVYDRALWPPGKIGLMSMCSVSTAAGLGR